MDILLNVNGNYEYNWKDSELYKFLSRHYMINELEIILNNSETIHLKKYNICGSNTKNKTLNIYNSNGETTTPIHTIPFHKIQKIKSTNHHPHKKK